MAEDHQSCGHIEEAAEHLAETVLRHENRAVVFDLKPSGSNLQVLVVALVVDDSQAFEAYEGLQAALQPYVKHAHLRSTDGRVQ